MNSPTGSATSVATEFRLNPDIFVGQTDAQILQNLVHQMCHEWQKTPWQATGAPLP